MDHIELISLIKNNCKTERKKSISADWKRNFLLGQKEHLEHWKICILAYW